MLSSPVSLLHLVGAVVLLLSLRTAFGQPSENDPILCTSLCSDGSLIDESNWNVQAFENQHFWGSATCRELELRVAEGNLNRNRCNQARYVGIKKCGCPEARNFCDLCEDGSVPKDLGLKITYQKNCLAYAGTAFSHDDNTDKCKAFRSTHGIYCGCNNPVAAQDACRLCDVDGGDAVSNPKKTVQVGSNGAIADCGELEFVGNDPSNKRRPFTCDQVTEFGKDCCSGIEEALKPIRLGTPPPTATPTTPPPATTQTPPPPTSTTTPPPPTPTLREPTSTTPHHHGMSNWWKYSTTTYSNVRFHHHFSNWQWHYRDNNINNEISKSKEGQHYKPLSRNGKGNRNYRGHGKGYDKWKSHVKGNRMKWHGNGKGGGKSRSKKGKRRL